jgi:prepilin-type N-terminal cleavage/methylation domain-containing protein
MSTERRRAGLTLVELVIVIGILSILAGIILAALGPAKEMGRVAACISNLRQIGQAYTMYRDDYGSFPAPGTPAMDSYVKDKRILFCPDDVSFALMGAATSYRFQFQEPPDFADLWDLREPNPNLVLAVCQHHVGPETKVMKGDYTQPVPPRYPYHLLLRLDGRVDRVHLSRVRKLFLSGDQPIYMNVYPGEPGYEQGRP